MIQYTRVAGPSYPDEQDLGEELKSQEQRLFRARLGYVLSAIALPGAAVGGFLLSKTTFGAGLGVAVLGVWGATQSLGLNTSNAEEALAAVRQLRGLREDGATAVRSYSI